MNLACHNATSYWELDLMTTNDGHDTGQSEGVILDTTPALNGAKEDQTSGDLSMESEGCCAPEGADDKDNASHSKLAKAFDARQTNALQLAAIKKAVAFTQIVSTLMRSSAHKQHALADLQWLVLPALERGQFKIAEAKKEPNGLSVPAGFLFWASVSPEVDKRLSENLDTPTRLKPDEWNSGEILWLVETLGDPRALRTLLKHFRDGLPEGRDVKLRIASPEGKVAVVNLSALTLDEEPSTQPIQ